MTRRLQFLSAAVLTGMLLAAPQAEARFGKRSSTESQDDSRETRESRDSGSTHDASPVNAPSPSHDSGRDDRPRGRPRYESRPRYYAPPPPVVYVDPAPSYYVEPAPSYYAAPVSSSVAAAADEYMSRRYKNFLFGLDTLILREGAGVALHLGFEGDRLGLMLRAGALSLRADDGSGDTDSLALLSGHLSWAVLKGDSGRLRLEGGLSMARAPDITFVGPSLGVSAEYYLSDFFALEGRVHLTPVPYRQLDAAGGVVVYFGYKLFALRGGMRMLVLNDAGLVDGVVHQDVLPGPYLSIGLTI
ncbi:hypothetical protein CYFUS_009872 [Cystobacter fuscus]|uniref:Outer membrane protein beta-barrel domain-containing protein n=1 Tax=Cystobacter fuscus TaxID=43 RepID=A0A250JKI0_9BACT|nr:hypothetical protein [Cystobacter fuscus]ATB44385.1 hypothetical protein CYFUS_009872 [Cystobacter fuscus]